MARNSNYGYNNKKEIYYVADNLSNGKYIKTEYTFQSIETTNNFFLNLHLLKVREENEYKFNLAQFKSLITNYLHLEPSFELSFKEQTLSSAHRFSDVSSINIGVFTVGIQSAQTFSTIATTANYHEQFYSIFNELNGMRQYYQKQVNEMILSGSQVKGALRSKGVHLVWKYEQAEIQMGGKGTSNWSRQERQNILKVGKVRGAEGHHINSVACHPKGKQTRIISVLLKIEQSIKICMEEILTIKLKGNSLIVINT